MSLEYTIRPLGAWPGPQTPADKRRNPAVFRAGWPATLEMLGRELGHLRAERVVLQVDVREGDLRVDGMLRANARVDHPGVRIAFGSRHGPLVYGTDVYYGWKANVRAIALALEALRAVDRHGVTRAGEQYRGWRAIAAGAGASSFGTADEAAQWMALQIDGVDNDSIDGVVHSLLAGGEQARRNYRQLVRQLHPDRGGDPANWARLDEAWRLLEEAR